MRSGSFRTRILCKSNEDTPVSSDVAWFLTFGSSNKNDRPWQKLPALKYHSYLLNLILSY
jgi:hypothetical protein